MTKYINKMDRLKQYEEVQREAIELFRKKNTDYGDAFADYGVVGILVRMNDKVRRYMSITNNKISLVNDESLRDTLINLHNYSAMAIMLMNEKKRATPILEEVKKTPLSFDEWNDRLGQDVYNILTEKGATREMDFNLEKELETYYFKYIEEIEKAH